MLKIVTLKKHLRNYSPNSLLRTSSISKKAFQETIQVLWGCLFLSRTFMKNRGEKRKDREGVKKRKEKKNSEEAV